MNSCYSIVKELLENCAKVDAQQKDGTHATFIAAQNGHLEALQLLLQKDPNVADLKGEGGRTPLVAAAKRVTGKQLNFSLHCQTLK